MLDDLVSDEPLRGWQITDVMKDFVSDEPLRDDYGCNSDDFVSDEPLRGWQITDEFTISAAARVSPRRLQI